MLRAGTKRRGRPPKLRNEERDKAGNPTLNLTSSTSTPKPTSNSLSTEQPNQAVFAPLKRAFTRTRALPSPSTAVPSWIMPCIHKLCRATGAFTAPSHVYVGTSSALAVFSSILPNESPKEDSLHGRAHVLALVVAVYLCVVFRMSRQPVTGQGFEEEARRALKVVETSESLIDNSIDDILEDINIWMERFEASGFLGGDWLQNVPTGTAQGEEVDDKAAVPYIKLRMRTFRDVEDAEAGKVTLLPGLGTMVRLTNLFLASELTVT